MPPTPPDSSQNLAALLTKIEAEPFESDKRGAMSSTENGHDAEWRSSLDRKIREKLERERNRRGDASRSATSPLIPTRGQMEEPTTPNQNPLRRMDKGTAQHEEEALARQLINAFEKIFGLSTDS